MAKSSTSKNPRSAKTPKSKTSQNESQSSKAVAKTTHKNDVDKEKLKKRNDRRSDRRGVLDTILKFKNFISCSFEPEITDTEIFVCFADVRGFTEYCRKLQVEMQDRKVQNFLKSFSKIFNQGLLDWFVEHTDEEFRPVQQRNLDIKELVIPTSYKNLGDGAMMVWEVPPSLSLIDQGNLAQQIMQVVENIEWRFNINFVDSLLPYEMDAYSQHVQELRIGFGVAKGHAWRLDYGTNIDYAGSVLNLAARLESLARPAGAIYHFDMSPWLFEKLMDADTGNILKISGIKGYSGSLKVYADETIDFTQPGFKRL